MNSLSLHKFAFSRLAVAAVLVSIFTVAPRLMVRVDASPRLPAASQSAGQRHDDFRVTSR